MNPLISFITPVYNNEKLILNTATSILSQTDDEIEYIIVDDGSTDNTPNVVDEIAKKDPRVKVIHQKNQWIYASLNNGIREATGEYIYIINSDDVLRNGAYKKMKNIVNMFHPDIIWTKVLIHKCDKNQNILQYDYLDWDSKVTSDEYFASCAEVRKAWCYFNQSLLALNQANLYKRELMLNHPFRNDVYGADTLFNISIARDVCSCYVMKDAVYDFFAYQTERNTSIGKFYDYEHEMFNDIFLEYEKLYKEFDIPKSQYEYIYTQRILQLTHEIVMLKCKNCSLTIEEKIERIFTHYVDDIVYSCAVKLSRVEELER